MAKQAAQEVLEFPSGGIADFYMEDDEIEALEREEAAQEFGSSGIATFEPIASRMASYGRYGDDTVAHVETGELVVPKALIDQNPKLRDSIFSHLRELGVEDPERYVVGSGANSLNPETGLPEFFFKKIFKGIKKTASKVAKGVSKAVKSVAKVIKKAAPVIIPFALNAMFPGLGAIYSGALGSGIGTLVQGGSLKDAFKSALIGGAIGGATAAIGGGMSAAKAGGSFSEGAVSGLKNAAKVSNLTTAGEQLVSGQFGQAGLDAVQMSPDAFVDYSPDKLVGEVAGKATDFGAGQGAYDPNLAATPMGATDAGLDASTRNQLYGVQPRPVVQGAPNTITGISSGYGPDPMAMGSTAGVGDQSAMLTSGVPDSTLSNIQTGSTNTIGGDGLLDTAKGYYDTAKDYLFQGGQTDLQLAEKASAANQNAIKNSLADSAAAGLNVKDPVVVAKALKAGEAAAAAAQPGLLATYGPSLALAGTAAYAGGMFDMPDPEDDPTTEDLQEQLGQTGEDLIAQNPGEYLITGNTEVPVGSTGQYVIPTDFAYAGQNYYNQNPFLRARGLGGTPFVQQAAEGGQIFPRRVGGIMPNEGVPGQDSVRAMLMPGEFVMTTDAVRGLGNGNNEQGINRMYDMMRGLEAKGKAMA